MCSSSRGNYHIPEFLRNTFFNHWELPRKRYLQILQSVSILYLHNMSYFNENLVSFCSEYNSIALISFLCSERKILVFVHLFSFKTIKELARALPFALTRK